MGDVMFMSITAATVVVPVLAGTIVAMLHCGCDE
jgi:hypothetical protein